MYNSLQQCYIRIYCSIELNKKLILPYLKSVFPASVKSNAKTTNDLLTKRCIRKLIIQLEL